MKTVLVTGAGGFIGQHALVSLQQQGFTIHATTSQAQAKISLPSDVTCQWHTVNLLNLSNIPTLMDTVRPTHLLHIAWDTTPKHYWTSTANFDWVQASLELVKQFRQHGGYRAVLAGTCAEYDWRYGYCSESLTPCQPNSAYGICKNALQKVVSTYSDSTGLSSAWGRVFFPYGPHEHPSRLVPSVIGALLRREPALCSHGNQIRDFLHVQDVADALVALLDSKVTGAVNIASGQPVTIKAIVTQIAEYLESLDLIRFGAIPISSQDVPLLVAQTQRLSDEVGWHPSRSLNEGLIETVQWWRSQLIKPVINQ